MVKEKEKEIKGLEDKLKAKEEEFGICTKRFEEAESKSKTRELELLQVIESQKAENGRQLATIQAHEASISKLTQDVRVSQDRFEAMQRDLGEKTALLSAIEPERAKWVGTLGKMGREGGGAKVGGCY